jgi:carbonic anhydrase/acetyltransferase-like protein (isoleucine patch superfamily)
MMIRNFRGKEPVLHDSVFVAESAEIIGNVRVDRDSSIWFNATIRADMNEINIGKGTSIQDNVVIHNDTSRIVEIGDNVSIGHGAVLHSCKIGNNVLIGMNATVLGGAEIGDNSIVGANALIAPGKRFGPANVITGTPGRIRREANDKDIKMIEENAAAYIKLMKEYKEQ